MIEDKTHMTVTVGEKKVECFCNKDMTLSDVFKAFDILRSYCLGRIKEFEDQQKAQKDVESQPES